MSRLLTRNIATSEFITQLGSGGNVCLGGFKLPNLKRAPFWQFIWQQHFINRQHGFNTHYSGMLVFLGFCWWTGMFDTAPLERRDKYYMQSAKYRMHCAYVNPGKRPAAKIAVEQAKVRYLFRGYDHPFTMNETKDFFFKLRENWVIQSGENIQYPYVFKQFTSAPGGTLDVHPYPRIPQAPHFNH